MGTALRTMMPTGAYALVYLTLIVLPLGAGLLGTLLPAAGYLPSLGFSRFSLHAWQQLFEQPGLSSSVLLSLTSGITATVLALLFSQLLCVQLWQRHSGHWLSSLARYLVATPHVTFAVALALLITPSGILARLFSPWLSGWQLPPDYPLPGDPWGLALIFGLALKETAFLLIVSLAALPLLEPQAQLRQARSLGYGPYVAWLLVIWPQLYSRLRLPIFIVLAFALSAVEPVAVLGPSQTPSLALKLTQWFNAADLQWRLPLAAGSVLLLALVLVGFALWRLLEQLGVLVLRYWAGYGCRLTTLESISRWACAASRVLLGLALLALVSLALSAGAANWQFPALWPQRWSWPPSYLLAGLQLPLFNTLGIAAFVAVLAVSLSLLGLQLSQSQPQWLRWQQRGLFAFLLLPQVTLLFGVQQGWVLLRWDGQWWTVVWSHLLFAWPYAWLMLRQPFAQLDPRYLHTSAALGLGPWARFFRVKLALLRLPIATALAMAFVISCALYLPTLFAGAGRVPTLVTESMALVSGGDRRMLATLSLAQTVLPLLALSLAAWLGRHKFQQGH